MHIRTSTQCRQHINTSTQTHQYTNTPAQCHQHIIWCVDDSLSQSFHIEMKYRSLSVLSRAFLFCFTALAGSTIMLLTIPWVLAVLAGRVDLDENGHGNYRPSKGQQKFTPGRSWATSGVEVLPSIRKNALVCLYWIGLGKRYVGMVTLSGCYPVCVWGWLCVWLCVCVCVCVWRGVFMRVACCVCVAFVALIDGRHFSIFGRRFSRRDMFVIFVRSLRSWPSLVWRISSFKDRRSHQTKSQTTMHPEQERYAVSCCAHCLHWSGCTTKTKL